MSYKLKPGTQSFTVVEGPFARRSFDRGKIYKEIPLQEAHRFEEVRDQASLIAALRGNVKPKTNEGAASVSPETGEV